MKTKLLPAIILATVLIGCNANRNFDTRTNRGVDTTRTNTYEVIYNFKNGKFDKNNNQIKVDNSVVFRIDSINNLAYEAKIRCKDSILAASFTNELASFLSENANPPAISKNINITNSVLKSKSIMLSTEDVSDTQGKDKNKIVEQMKSISKLEVLLKQQSVIEDSLNIQEKRIAELKRKADESYKKKIDTEEEVKDIDTKIKEIDVKISLENDDQKLRLGNEKKNLEITKEEKRIALKKILDEITSFENKITDTEYNFKVIQNQVLTNKETISKLSEIKEFSLKKFADDSERFIKAYGTVENIYKKSLIILSFYKETTGISQNPKLTYGLYKNEYKNKLQKIFSDLLLIQSDIADFQNQYTNLQNLYSYAKYNPALDDVLNSGGQDKLYGYLDDLKILADKMNENFKANDFEKILNYMKQVIPLLNKPETFFVVSNPIQPMDDIVIFDVDIKKRNNNSVNELYGERKFKHREFTYGGTRFDLGIGLSGALFPNVKAFEFQTITTKIGDNPISQTLIYRKSDQTYSPSLVGMFTASYRSTHYISFGGSVGMGLDLKDDKIELNSFYVGPSIIMGKYDRIVITAGATVKEVDILKQGYEIGSAYDSKDNGNDFLTKEYRAGIFVSITYNLTKGVRDNIKYLNSLTK